MISTSECPLTQACLLVPGAGRHSGINGEAEFEEEELSVMIHYASIKAFALLLCHRVTEWPRTRCNFG